MATGTGERPLGSIAQEKTLLGVNGFNVTTYEIASGTAYVHLPRNPNAMRTGLIVFVGGYTGSSGMYAYGRRTGTSNALIIDAIKAPTRSGVSVAVSGDDVVITTDVYLVIRVVYLSGGAPTVSNTPPA